jgi:gas vesicle protein
MIRKKRRDFSTFQDRYEIQEEWENFQEDQGSLIFDYASKFNNESDNEETEEEEELQSEVEQHQETYFHQASYKPSKSLLLTSKTEEQDDTVNNSPGIS